jgi:hypothetical protein
LKKSIKETCRIINTVLWSFIEKPSLAELKTGKLIVIEKLIESLSRLMTRPTDPQTVATTIEALKWIMHLVNNQPELILEHVDAFFSILIPFLSDSNNQVVELDLTILASISCSQYLIDLNNQDENLKHNFPKYNTYFTKFMSELLELFRYNANLRYEKGSLIIRLIKFYLNKAINHHQNESFYLV